MKLYLLGGRPCSGKTTLAYSLGNIHGIDVEYLDVFAQKCINESTTQTPNIYRWNGKDLVDVLQKKPQILFDEYIKFYEEMFPLLLLYLKELKQDKVILEASILLPKFISILEETFETKICYLITEDIFVKEKYVKRDYVLDMLNKPNGEVALNNLLERDSLFAKYIESELEKYLFPSFEIKPKEEVTENLKKIEIILGLYK